MKFAKISHMLGSCLSPRLPSPRRESRIGSQASLLQFEDVPTVELCFPLDSLERYVNPLLHRLLVALTVLVQHEHGRSSTSYSSQVASSCKHLEQ
mmetsp:Transcript_48156/g.151075  ORF Transcript_48156/g.151075 Transcript_48156/m.151075 type:complete len:95 (-) Transcript_48156:768-1052(-)